MSGPQRKGNFLLGICLLGAWSCTSPESPTQFVDLLTELAVVESAQPRLVHLTPGDPASAFLLEGRWLKQKEADTWTWVRCTYQTAAIHLPIHDLAMNNVTLYVAADERIRWRFLKLRLLLNNELCYEGLLADQPMLVSFTAPQGTLHLGLNRLQFEFDGVLGANFELQSVEDFFYCKLRDITIGQSDVQTQENQFAFIGYLSLNQVTRRTAILAGGGDLVATLPPNYVGPLTFQVGYPVDQAAERDVLVEAIRGADVVQVLKKSVKLEPSGPWQTIQCGIPKGFELLRFRATSSLAIATPQVEMFAEGKTEIPDVILVSIDTLRADYLGVYGAATSHTPFLDALSKRAYQFVNTYSQSAVTNPSHASILTGTYLHQHNVLGNTMSLSLSALTLFEVLQDQGYRTVGAVAVRHMSADSSGFGQGFEVFYGTDQNKKSGRELIVPLVTEIGAADTRPLAVFAHFFDPHVPYEPVPGGAYFSQDLEYVCPEAFKANEEFSETETRKYMGQYRAEVAEVDSCVEELFLAWQEKRPGRELVMVIVADHGESLYEHGLFFQHHTGLFEPHVRVPLLCYDSQGRWPKGFTTRAVETIDIAPTLIRRLCNRDLKSSPGHQLFVAKNVLLPVRNIHAEAADYAAAVWQGDVKAIFPLKANPLFTQDLLYDLKTDPQELSDRVQDHHDLFQRITESAAKWRLKTTESMPESYSLYDEEDQESLRALGYVH